MADLKSKLIEGTYTAIVTPFNDSLEIDYDAFSKLIDMQQGAGIDGLVVCGTTGESPTLSADEKIALIEFAVKKVSGKMKIMAGTGGNDTRSTVELSKRAEEVGADSLLIVTPPYNKPSLAGLFAHFQAVSDATTLPICLYHVPGRTGQRLTADQLSKLCGLEKVIAVKEASGDVNLFSKSASNSDANYLSGDDPTYLASLSVGGSGVISVLTNVFPEAYVKMRKEFMAGNFELATKIHNATSDFVDALFIESNPTPTKYILCKIGMMKNNFRLPLVPVTKESEKTIADLYAQTKLKLESLL